MQFFIFSLQYNTIQYKTYNAPYVTKMLFVGAVSFSCSKFFSYSFSFSCFSVPIVCQFFQQYFVRGTIQLHGYQCIIHVGRTHKKLQRIILRNACSYYLTVSLSQSHCLQRTNSINHNCLQIIQNFTVYLRGVFSSIGPAGTL